MRYLVIFLLTICSVTAFSQAVSTEYTTPFIEVTGTAEKEVVPDEIYIGFRITAKLFSGIESQENKLKKELEKIGIAASNLYVAGATNEIIWRKTQKIGVDESRDYSLKVSNVAQLKSVYDAFGKVGIEEAQITEVNHSSIDSLRKEVRISALKAAKDKAVYLLASVGEQPGKPLEIKEEESNPYPFFNRNPMANTILSSNTSSTENNLNYSRMLIKFSYTVKYAIK